MTDKSNYAIQIGKKERGIKRSVDIIPPLAVVDGAVRPGTSAHLLNQKSQNDANVQLGKEFGNGLSCICFILTNGFTPKGLDMIHIQMT